MVIDHWYTGHKVTLSYTYGCIQLLLLTPNNQLLIITGRRCREQLELKYVYVTENLMQLRHKEAYCKEDGMQQCAQLHV